MAGDVIAWRPGYGDSAEAAEGPVQNYTETFYATLRTKNTSPVAIFKHRECPKRGERHRDDPAAYVSRIKPVRMGETRIWNVTVEYTTDITAASNEADPLKRPAIITITTTVEDVLTLFEADGKLRINTAADIVPGTKKKPFQVYRIEKNVADIPDWFLDWPGSVNKYDFVIDNKIHEARTMMLLPVERPQKLLENGKWYYPLVYSLRQDRATYDVAEPSMGFHELIPKTGTIDGKEVTKLVKERIVIGTNSDYPKEKQFLDKNGRRIDLQEDKKKGGPDLSKIYIQKRRDLEEQDFSILPVT